MELKRPPEYNPKLSKEQAAWIEKMRAVGYKAEVFHDAEEAYNSFMEYLNTK
jgi:hypothetical protein